MWLIALLTGIETRQLQEFGSIEVPKRLEPRTPVEITAAYSLFPFERVKSGFRYMGSNTPVCEKLVVATWVDAAHYAEARKQAIQLARDRTGDLRWLDSTLAEGVHEVNTHKSPAWIVVHEAREKQMLVVYMVWKQEAPASAARVSAEAGGILGTFKPGKPGYWSKAVERPIVEREKRMQLLQASLTKRGIQLVTNAGPVEHNGAFYEISTRDGRVFTALLPLGEIPYQANFRHLRPPTPRNVGNWPSILWFERENGKIVPHFVDGEFRITERMSRLAGPSAKGKAKFYALQVFLIDDLDMPKPDMDFAWDMQPKMAALLLSGKLVSAQP